MRFHSVPIEKWEISSGPKRQITPPVSLYIIYFGFMSVRQVMINYILIFVKPDFSWTVGGQSSGTAPVEATLIDLVKRVVSYLKQIVFTVRSWDEFVFNTWKWYNRISQQRCTCSNEIKSLRRVHRVLYRGAGNKVIYYNT